MDKMKEVYGKDRARQVFYAMRRSGKLKGVDLKGVDRARRRKRK
jgi:hypothetical protein